MRKLCLLSAFTASLAASPASPQSANFIAEYGLWHAITSSMTAVNRCGRFDANDDLISMRMVQMKVSIEHAEWLKARFNPIVEADITAMGLARWCDQMWKYFCTKGTMISNLLAIRPPDPSNQKSAVR